MKSIADMGWHEARDAVRTMTDADLRKAVEELAAIDAWASSGHMRLVVREQLRRHSAVRRSS